jgi:CO dehydrogenase/acetyl-CoA synthase alpha subunit
VQPTQADSEIEKEHLLNFVVNSLEEELVIDLGENVEVTTEKLYEVLAGTGSSLATPPAMSVH